jgi:hypothetical protein
VWERQIVSVEEKEEETKTETYPNSPSFEKTSHPVDGGDVLRVDGSGETVFGGVGNLNRFFFVLELDDARDGSKDLLLGDAMIHGDVGKNSRLDEVALGTVSRT